jgi:hypothetical protein
MARRKKQNEEEQENSDNINNESDDTFGLPEVEYEPLKRDEPKDEPKTEPVTEAPQPEPVFERPYEEIVPEAVDENRYDTDIDADDKSSYTYEEEESSNVGKYLGIALLVLVVGGLVYWLAVYRPQQEKAEQERLAGEKARREQLAQQNREKQLEEERLAREKRVADSLAAIPKTGTLQMLEGRTGQYYVVVASAIDVDLLTDFGSKLVKKGSTVRIIPPFGKTKFHRLAVDVRETYADAQARADEMKGGDFGNDIWVVRY